MKHGQTEEHSDFSGGGGGDTEWTNYAIVASMYEFCVLYIHNVNSRCPPE